MPQLPLSNESLKEITTIRERLQTSGSLNRVIQSEVREIYNALKSLQEGLKFPKFREVNVPMVLILGNHSSGKSSFINYMLKQQVQKTGIYNPMWLGQYKDTLVFHSIGRAPTDSTFTVIKGGSRAERLDGFALLRSRQFSFQDMHDAFGSNFIAQLELKVVENSELLDSTGMLLIDSPGMIDPPGLSNSRTDMDRGYDFKGVVRWFADRADVILVMFDPDKPGTTFETLDVLMSSLSTYSSKVHLILNKVDDFRTVHDFARAYGALCWNLSKMIPRKDLPFLYPMYVPNESKNNRIEDDQSTLQNILTSEFDGIRDEIILEVSRAPDRSTDNLINDLKSFCTRLKMHSEILHCCREEYMWLDRIWRAVTYFVGVAGVFAISVYIIHTKGPKQITSIPSSPDVPSTDWKAKWEKQILKNQTSFSWIHLFKIVASTSFGILTSWRIRLNRLEKKRNNILLWLPDVFRKQYSDQLSHPDRNHNEILSRWKLVYQNLEISLKSIDIREIPKLDAEEQRLQNIIDIHIPRLDKAIRNREGDEFKSLLRKSKDPK